MTTNEDLFFDEFYDALTKSVAADGYKTEKVDIPKTNTMMRGINIVPKEGTTDFTPIVYPENYYEEWMEGGDMDEIITGIKNTIKETSAAFEPGLSLIKPENARGHIRAAVAGYEGNETWLDGIPHERIEDLAVYAKWHFDDHSAATITNGLANRLEMTKEEILKMAKENTATEYKFESLEDALKDSMREMGIDEETIDETFKFGTRSPLYVLTTQDGHDGAALIADPAILKGIRAGLNEDIYILPSSVHEILILPESYMAGDVDALKDMVKSVNDTEVDLQDRLSYEVYEFDARGLHIADSENLKIADEMPMPGIANHHKR